MTRERLLDEAKKFLESQGWFEQSEEQIALTARAMEVGERLGRDEERKECVASLNDRVALAKYMESYSQDVSPEVSEQVKLILSEMLEGIRARGLAQKEE